MEIPYSSALRLHFSVLFILTSLLSTWVKSEFGIAGIYSLAAISGLLISTLSFSIWRKAAHREYPTALAAAILIAASSNNFLKAGYAADLPVDMRQPERRRAGSPCDWGCRNRYRNGRPLAGNIRHDLRPFKCPSCW